VFWGPAAGCWWDLLRESRTRPWLRLKGMTEVTAQMSVSLDGGLRRADGSTGPEGQRATDHCFRTTNEH